MSYSPIPEEEEDGVGSAPVFEIVEADVSTAFLREEIGTSPWPVPVPDVTEANIITTFPEEEVGRSSRPASISDVIEADVRTALPVEELGSSPWPTAPPNVTEAGINAPFPEEEEEVQSSSGPAPIPDVIGLDNNATLPDAGSNSGPEPTQAPDVIEADDRDALENDSAFGDGYSDLSSKTSLHSGVARYRIENGRRYHGYRDGKYLLPNDETEQDRLDLHHHIFNLVSEGKLFYAPIKDPSRVLDAGTGTGIWAIDFADQFPNAHVIGSDLSPIQPGWIPPNLEFEIDDVEDPWRHSLPFSYIHVRSLSGAIKSFPSLIGQAFENLEPGGWLEIMEFEVWIHDQAVENLSSEEKEKVGEVRKAHMIDRWQAGLSDAGERIGRSFTVAVNLKRWMEEAGLENVREVITRVPNTPWPRNKRQKEIGLYQQQNMLDASSSYGQAHFTRVLGWSSEEYEVLSAGVRAEFKDLTFQLYSKLYVVYGQKPKAAE